MRFKRHQKIYAARMRLALVTNQLGLRGTEVVLASYARHAQNRWGWTVTFVVRHARENRPATPDTADLSYAHYESQFDVVYSGNDAATNAWLASNVDVALVEIGGFPEDWLPTTVPVIAHCVFTAAHALRCTLHTAISESVPSRLGVTVLPYVVEHTKPNGTLRTELGIPPDALVFGRHGGWDTFDIPWVHEVVTRVASQNTGIYFIFMNTRPFCTPTPPHIIHVPPTTCAQRKANFVATCDAMLHARVIGETFGMAIAEFAMQRTPVLTYAQARDTEHLRLLGTHAVVYKDAAHLQVLLERFERGAKTGATGYGHYGPESVMPSLKVIAKIAVSLGRPREPAQT